MAANANEMDGLTSQARQTPGGRTVLLVGVLDISTRDVAVQACLGPADQDVVVDLGGLTFMDCAGYAGIVMARDALGRRGRTLTIQNQADEPARLITLVDALASNSVGPQHALG